MGKLKNILKQLLPNKIKFFLRYLIYRYKIINIWLLEANELDVKSLDINKFINAPIIDEELFYTACRCFAISHQHILEFGVGSGNSINILAKIFHNKTVYGFDSFEGLPEDWIKNPGRLDYPKGHFKTELPRVRQNVVLVKGLFQDVLPKWLKCNSGNVSLLHIDSDLYSSAKYVLFTLNSRIKKGALLFLMKFIDGIAKRQKI